MFLVAAPLAALALLIVLRLPELALATRPAGVGARRQRRRRPGAAGGSAGREALLESA